MGKKRQKADSAVPTSTTSYTLASDGGETSTAQVSLGNSGGLAVHRGSSRPSCPYSVHQVLNVLLVYLQALSKPMIHDHVALICDHSNQRCCEHENQVEQCLFHVYSKPSFQIQIQFCPTIEVKIKKSIYNFFFYLYLIKPVIHTFCHIYYYILPVQRVSVTPSSPQNIQA